MIKNTEEALLCLLSPLPGRWRKVGPCKKCKWGEFCIKVSELRGEYEAADDTTKIQGGKP